MPTASSTPALEQRLKIGQRIIAVRDQLQMTQRDLAEKLGTSQSAVARMEKGEQNFSTEMLVKISRALGRDIITLASGSINFRIEGGHQLSGTIVTKSSKNAAVSLLMASLLNRGTTTLKSMPRIEEVNRLIEVLVSIGVGVKWTTSGDIKITPPAQLNLDSINVEAAIKTRSVIMAIGPLAHLFDKFSIPQPGGCKLGERSVRPHLYALEKFGVRITAVTGAYEIESRDLHTADVVLYESGDTVTENALMAAAKLPGVSRIKFASANYMVQDVCYFLMALGVKIEGIGTSTLTVHGKAEINEDVVYAPSEDPIESMLFLSLAATTKSEITIKRAPIDFLELELLKMEKMGFVYDITQRYKAQNGYTDLVDIVTHPSELHALEEKIHPNVYPGLNIDNLPFFVPMATQAIGQTMIHDWVYENRAIYFYELAKLGADIIIADAHRVYVKGPSHLRGAEVICPPALRPAAIVLIAMLAADGVSVLRNVYSINRGYEDLVGRLQSLGAHIEQLYEL